MASSAGTAVLAQITAPGIYVPGQAGVPQGFVPLRESPFAADAQDPARVQYVLRKWSEQDQLWRHRNRQIEENVRMLAGQQWSVYNPLSGRWMDVSEWMDADERRWRQFPVFDRLQPWFILTHARLTENPPIITFVPGPDRIDADLAETMDTIFKTTWFSAGMTEVVDRMMAWLIPAGRAHLQSRIDLNGGDLVAWTGTSKLALLDEHGEPVTAQDDTGAPIPMLHDEGPEYDDVPFDANGNPLVGIHPESGQVRQFGDPHQSRQGRLVVDVLSPLQVRNQWGPQPFHQAAWHATRTYLTPAEVYEQYGVDVSADTKASATDTGELERVLFGTGFFGASDVMAGTPAALGAGSGAQHTDGFVEVTTLWERPCRYGGMEETEESAGGRMIAVTRNHVLRDGVRPARFPFVSPLRTFDFVNLPGRPSGTSPQDNMNQAQRALNRNMAQLAQHVALTTNPKALINSQSGIDEGEWSNAPGESYVVNPTPTGPAVTYLVPPPLSPDVYKHTQLLREFLQETGNMRDTSTAPQQGVSGEQVKELRFDTDRFVGPTVRRAVEEFARVAQDWMAVIPLIYDREQIISFAGEDYVARTVTVYPELFDQGKVNVRPDVESMLPEGRGERQNRIYKMYMDGLFGLPGSPTALKQFFDLARFPHLARTARPGGVNRVTAEQELGRLLQGTPASEIPVYEWYDDDTHLAVLEEHMASPEFLKNPPAVMQALAEHRQAHLDNKAMKAAKAQSQAFQQVATQHAMAQSLAGGAAGGIAGGPGGPGGPPGLPSAPPGAPPGAPAATGDLGAPSVVPDPASLHAPSDLAVGQYPTTP